MSILDDYRAKINIDGTTPRNRTINTRVREYETTFKRAPEYEQVRVTNDTSNTINYDSWIYANSSFKELVSMKTIIFAPGTPSDIVFSGQYIRPQRQGGLFMLYSDDKQYEDKLKGLMDECTETLRRYNDDGVLIEVPIILRSRSTGNQDEDKYMILTDGSHQVGLPINPETLKWGEGTSFILSNRHKYRIAWIDDVRSSTYMEFRLRKYEENLELDNLELGIADYANRAIFTLTTNDAVINMQSGQTRQIEYILMDRNNQESDKPVIYASSNDTIATVDDNGLVSSLADGTTVIRVAMQNNPDVYAEVTVNVVASVPDNFSYVVTPDIGTIFRLQDETFNIQAYNNNEDVSETYTVTIQSSTADSDDYVFELVGNDGYRIKNNGATHNSNIVIRVTPDSRTQDTFDVTYVFSGSYS